MNRRVVFAHTAGLTGMLAVLLLCPAVVAWLDADGAGMGAYVSAAALTGLVALLFRRLGRGAPDTIHRKDAFGIVALIWAILGALGAVPMLLDGSIPDVPGAIFEAVSGFTTTGATVVPNVDGLSRATHLWRCLMHWVGGMGIVVLFVAIFPVLGVGAKQLFKTEVPGPITEGVRPRIRETANALWWVYAGATLVCALLLVLLGMGPFDAICHAFSTLGTGGFSTRSASVGAWSSPAIHWVIAFFMLVAGMNFSLYYAALRGRGGRLWRDTELRFYLALNAVVIAIVFLAILPRHMGVEPALRHASFQVLSVTTTTGFMTEDFETYGDLSRLLLLLCMFIGGCAGSTAGGLKASRVLLLFKLIAREVRAVVQPQVVLSVRLGDRAVPRAILSSVLVFGAAYLAIFACASVLLLAMGVDLLTGFSASIACLSSIGPGLAGVGPTQSYAAIPGAGKLVLSVCMIAGRLELFALLAVFTRDCWRKG